MMTSDTCGQSILIVDDEQDLTEGLVELFENCGWNAVGAYSGPEGFEKFVRMKPDVVLLDILMPGESGLQVLPRMIQVDPEACILVLTALSGEPHFIEAFRAGAWDYIVKPVAPDRLVERVEQGLRQFHRVVRGMRAEQMFGFVRAVSHSLKNKLDPLRVFSLMLRDEPDAAERRKLWQEMNTQCEDYRALLDRFERFARMTTPQVEDFRLDVLLQETARSAVARFGRQHFARAEAVVSAAPAVMRGDRVLMGEVLDTLLTNAFEASPSVGAVQATLTVAEEGDVATITVLDEGGGFAPEVVDKVGRSLVSTRSNFGNYGIGLLMASRVARFYRGQLKTGNRENGRGAWVELSVHLDHEPGRGR